MADHTPLEAPKRYKHRLNINGEFVPGGWRLAEESDTGGVMQWEGMQLCVSKDKGMMLDQLSVYSTTLTEVTITPCNPSHAPRSEHAFVPF